jgi:hypothetical protein
MMEEKIESIDPVLNVLTSAPELYWDLASRAGVKNCIAFERLVELVELGLAEKVAPSTFRRRADEPEAMSDPEKVSP